MLSARIELSHGAFLLHQPELVPRARADELFEWLRDHVAWQQGFVSLFGKRIAEPRLTAWFGPFDYRYSGRHLVAAPWPAALSDLGETIRRATDFEPNSVLANRYRDGRDGVGFHADDEPELGEEPVVASVSFGATRRFVVRPKRKSDGKGITLELGHGDLLLMGGSCQRHFRHAVPKQPSIDGERINLTFRRMLRSSSQS